MSTSSRKRREESRLCTSFPLTLLTFAWALPALAQLPPGGEEHPALGADRITQATIESGSVRLKEIRSAGRRIFATPFNALDGLGDGPLDPNDKISPGGRPTLQDNGMFLRMNGLDSQTCLECHNVLSAAEFPARFTIGGAGGVGANAMPGVILPDVADQAGNGFAAITGRFINPPFVFGSGGVELLAKEMTAELQQLKAQAIATPGQPVPLISKGVSFGFIVCNSGGECDTTNVEGIAEDLVVRPFGRKGQFATTRAFDIGALQFHHGMQPVEVVGIDVDADGDGVANEILVGELSALHIFMATMERPRETKLTPESASGKTLFEQIGCAGCHIPELMTESGVLTLSFPEIETDPSANTYYSVDLTARPTRFDPAPGAGVRVPLYADLKRHDMGAALGESTGSELDPLFTTARLWGVADTPPYLHDGRATTLSEAIFMHGGDAQQAANMFQTLSEGEKAAVVSFLRTLRTPKRVGRDLDRYDRHNPRQY